VITLIIDLENVVTLGFSSACATRRKSSVLTIEKMGDCFSNNRRSNKSGIIIVRLHGLYPAGS